jgi:predicted GIY-YIG superfamily endonuclease
MTHTLRLYVVLLDDAVRSVGRFGKENSGSRGPCLYVGSTAHTPEHRFSQHKAGRFSNRGWVERFGVKLAQHLSDGKEYQTRESAEQAERELAESLREKGYAVWSR